MTLLYVEHSLERAWQAIGRSNYSEARTAALEAVAAVSVEPSGADRDQFASRAHETLGVVARDRGEFRRAHLEFHRARLYADRAGDARSTGRVLVADIVTTQIANRGRTRRPAFSRLQTKFQVAHAAIIASGADDLRADLLHRLAVQRVAIGDRRGAVDLLRNHVIRVSENVEDADMQLARWVELARTEIQLDPRRRRAIDDVFEQAGQLALDATQPLRRMQLATVQAERALEEQGPSDEFWHYLSAARTHLETGSYANPHYDRLLRRATRG
ncbi:MAG TPA: hypothetical protein VF715_03865 [Thermoleophilaceae bacterium]